MKVNRMFVSALNGGLCMASHGIMHVKLSLGLNLEQFSSSEISQKTRWRTEEALANSIN